MSERDNKLNSKPTSRQGEENTIVNDRGGQKYKAIQKATESEGGQKQNPVMRFLQARYLPVGVVAIMVGLFLLALPFIAPKTDTSYIQNTEDNPTASGSTKQEVGQAVNTLIKIDNVDASSIKTENIDGVPTYSMSRIMSCEPSSNYSVDSSGYLLDGNGAKVSAITGHSNAYSRYGEARCNISLTGTYQEVTGQNFSKKGFGGEFSLDKNNGKFILSRIKGFFANGDFAFGTHDDGVSYDEVSLIISDENSGNIIEEYKLTLNYVLSGGAKALTSTWISKINNKSSSYDGSSSSRRSSSSSTDWEAYCADVFPGNDAYNKAARESCARSAESTERLMNGGYSK